MEKLNETKVKKQSEELSKAEEQQLKRKLDAKELKLKKIKQMFNDLDIDNELSGLFYNSIRLFFELGKELTENLNEELYSAALRKYRKKKEEK
jgi:hypothetical protein